MITEKNVLDALSNVEDPDLKKDLVTLGMIRDIRISDERIGFSVVLPSPAYPSKEHINQACINAIHQHIDSKYEVDVHMTAEVNQKIQKDERLKNIKNIVAVASGKGGVGKSTVTANLAVSLSKLGAKVGIIDADIYGPSMPIMFDLENQKPGITYINGESKIVPLENHGIKVLSIGFLIKEDQAVVWRGPMVTKALRQFLYDADWGELDYLLIDLPPGTGDIQLSLTQMVAMSGAVFVTTPQKVAMTDVNKSINMFSLPNVKVNVLGIVENMAYFVPEDMPEKKYFIFGEDGGKEVAKKFNKPFLGQIPLVQGIRKGGDEGKPMSLEKDHPISNAFKEIAQALAHQIDIKNAKFVTA